MPALSTCIFPSGVARGNCLLYFSVGRLTYHPLHGLHNVCKLGSYSLVAKNMGQRETTRAERDDDTRDDEEHGVPRMRVPSFRVRRSYFCE